MEREKKQPCYLCSRTRRLAIFDLADEIGANVIAFGHHRDDFIQTFMMNLFCNGSIEAMKPNNPFFDGKYRIIRPMVYIKESSIAAETQNSGIQPLDTGCSFSHVSERHFIREKLKEIYAQNFKLLGDDHLDFGRKIADLLLSLFQDIDELSLLAELSERQLSWSGR